MQNPVNRIEQFRIWRKGLEVADSVQKMANCFSHSGSGDIWGKLKEMTFSMPSYLAEGFMMKNVKDGKAQLYRALNCLDEILKSLIFTERAGGIKKGQIRRIKRDIMELKSLLDLACFDNEEMFLSFS